MKKNPQYTIPKPCNKRWSHMRNVSDSEFKICENCDEKVYDLRRKSPSQIDDWFQSNNKNLCVIAHTNQLASPDAKAPFILNLRKIGIASVIIGSSLLPSTLYAQTSKTPNTYVLEQIDTTSEKITIEGIVKVKGLIGWRKLDEYSVYVYSKDSLVSESLFDEKGMFKIELDKNVLADTMTIFLYSTKYRSIQIEEIEVKNTMLTMFLEKRSPRVVVGRFF